jgi:Zn finger protein HypA/HybF involved in hydrogenase expression
MFKVVKQKPVAKCRKCGAQPLHKPITYVPIYYNQKEASEYAPLCKSCAKNTIAFKVWIKRGSRLHIIYIPIERP